MLKKPESMIRYFKTTIFTTWCKCQNFAINPSSDLHLLVLTIHFVELLYVATCMFTIVAVFEGKKQYTLHTSKGYCFSLDEYMFS